MCRTSSAPCGRGRRPGLPCGATPGPFVRLECLRHRTTARAPGPSNCCVAASTPTCAQQTSCRAPRDHPSGRRSAAASIASPIVISPATYRRDSPTAVKKPGRKLPPPGARDARGRSMVGKACRSCGCRSSWHSRLQVNYAIHHLRLVQLAHPASPWLEAQPCRPRSRPSESTRGVGPDPQARPPRDQGAARATTAMRPRRCL